MTIAAAMVHVNVMEENLTDTERLPKDSCCKKCSDLQTQLQEALKELSSAHLITELLRNEASIGQNQQGSSDPTENLHVKTKWSNVVTGRSIGRRKEDSTSNRILESNITSPSTEKQWKTVNRGHKKLPTVNHALCYQILVIINQYELLRNRGKDEQMAHEPMKTHELELRNEDRDKIHKKTNKQKEKKHTIIVTGDSHAQGCAAEIKSNLDEDFKVQGFVNPGTGLNTIITSAKRDIQQLSKQDLVVAGEA